MNAKIENIRSVFKRFANLLEIRESDDLLSFEATDDGSPHVEIVGNSEFHFVVTERGSELERRKTNSADQLMYWIFSAITFSMASDYELKHRHPTNDFRRLLFSKQLELLSLLSVDWSEKRNAELRKTLVDSPYKDSAS